MRKFIGIFIGLFVVAFLTCCKDREGDETAVYEQREFLQANIFKDTLSGFIVLTPQFADSLLDAAVATKNRDAICVAINAVIDSRDSAATEKAILAAMNIPGKEKVMTHLDDRCKKLTVSLLKEGQIASATKIYHHNLVACDSLRFTIGKGHLEEVKKMRSSLANVLIIVILVVAIICLTVYLVRAKQQDKEYVYESVTSRLQDSIDEYQQMLDDLQATNSDNKRETDMLRRQIDSIQERLMERMQRGRALYLSLTEGNPMPYDLKDADSYLIDYVMLFYPAKYRQWTEQYDKLTPRAFTYLILCDMGHSDAKIQEILSISASSVRSIKSRLNAKKK